MMKPGNLSPSDDRTTANPDSGLRWSQQDLRILSRLAADQPRPAAGPRMIRLSPQAQGRTAASRRGGWPTKPATGLMVLGFALLALLVGVLTFTGRSNTSEPGSVTQSTVGAGPPLTEAAAADVGATATADGADLRAEATNVSLVQSEPDLASSASSAGDGEAVVRSFYAALGRGDGIKASALVVPEKRSSRAFSAQAISRFYGGLREPLRLTAITSVGRDKYRVGYRYSAGSSRCDGEAVVSLTSRDGRELIRSIQALNGC